MTDKFILDACCGGRTFWVDKKQPNTIYMDFKPRPKGTIKARPNWCCEPDVVADFKDMPFKDKTFKLVVFDPPHLVCGESGWQCQKYGSINKETWKEDLKEGFEECWRVLEDYGVLVFKWNESQYSKKEVLEVLERRPLFGHPILSKTKTHWFTFMKIPECSLNLNNKSQSD